MRSLVFVGELFDIEVFLHKVFLFVSIFTDDHFFFHRHVEILIDLASEVGNREAQGDVSCLASSLQSDDSSKLVYKYLISLLLPFGTMISGGM